MASKFGVKKWKSWKELDKVGLGKAALLCLNILDFNPNCVRAPLSE